MITNIDLNIINLDENFDEEDSNTIILIRLLGWHTKFEKRKEPTKELNEELMSVAWHPKTWWDWFVSEDEKKKQVQCLLKSYKSVINVQIRGIECFYLWDVFWPEVLKHFKHRNCLTLIKIFKSIYGSYKLNNWIIFKLKMFQYHGPKCVPSEQTVSIPPICILLGFIYTSFFLTKIVTAQI